MRLPRRLRFACRVSFKGGVPPFSNHKGWGSSVFSVSRVGFIRSIYEFIAVTSTQATVRSEDTGGGEVGPCRKSWARIAHSKGLGSTVYRQKGGVPPFVNENESPSRRAMRVPRRSTSKFAQMGPSAGSGVTAGRKVIPEWSKIGPHCLSERLLCLVRVLERPLGVKTL